MLLFLLLLMLLPHASLAVNVLVCEREHPLLDTEPSLAITVGVLQASVAVLCAKCSIHISC
jgi:hypothetical protein